MRDLWDGNAWDLQRTSFIFPPSVVKLILSQAIHWFNDEPDGICWNSPSGCFISMDAYALCIDGSSSSLYVDWTWLWKIPANPRIIHFIWLVAHGRLTTKDNLFTRHITPNPFCAHCPDLIEIISMSFGTVLLLALCGLLSFPLVIVISSTPLPPHFMSGSNSIASFV